MRAITRDGQRFLPVRVEVSMQNDPRQTAPRLLWSHYVIVVALAGIVGTGSALLVQSRASAPTVTPSSAASSSAPETPATPPASSEPLPLSALNGSAPAPAVPSAEQHTPPAEITAGMTESQSALTLGNWYFDHEVWPQAEKQYRRALALGIDTPDVRTDLGSALRFGGKAREGLQQYLLAQKQSPEHENSLFNQGGIYAFDLKQPAKAVAVWREYLSRFPQGKSALQARQLIQRVQANKTTAPAKKP